MCIDDFLGTARKCKSKTQSVSVFFFVLFRFFFLFFSLIKHHIVFVWMSWAQTLYRSLPSHGLWMDRCSRAKMHLNFIQCVSCVLENRLGTRERGDSFKHIHIIQQTTATSFIDVVQSDYVQITPQNTSWVYGINRLSVPDERIKHKCVRRCINKDKCNSIEDVSCFVFKCKKKKQQQQQHRPNHSQTICWPFNWVGESIIV